jgi:CRP-like cAMP-binding protein
VDAVAARVLDGSPIVRAAASPTREVLLAKAQWRFVLPEEELLPTAALAVIDEGVAGIYDAGEPERLLAAYLGRGDIAGCEALGGIAPRALAITEVRMLCIPIPVLDALLAQDADLRRALFGLVVRRVHQNERRMRRTALPVRQRLAAFLVDAMERWGKADPERGVAVESPLTQIHIGQLLGAQREMVSRALTALRQDGIVETDSRRIVVLDEARLRAEAR